MNVFLRNPYTAEIKEEDARKEHFSGIALVITGTAIIFAGTALLFTSAGDMSWLLPWLGGFFILLGLQQFLAAWFLRRLRHLEKRVQDIARLPDKGTTGDAG